MTSWMTYKGLELPDSPTTDPGDKLAEDLRLLADGPGSGLRVVADSYVVAQRGEDDLESAENLRAAYAAAKLLTPGGNALSATNRAVCFVPPGRYDFGTGDASNHGLVLDEEFVDLIGLSTAREDTVLASQIATASRGTLEQTADAVRIANLTIRSEVTSGSGQYAAYFPNSDLSGTLMRNVKFEGNAFSRGMRPGIEYSGTFVGCEGSGTLGREFGCDGTASGVFIGCVGGELSFGADGTASGTFIDCIGGLGSLGGNTGTASGTFIRCRLGTATTFGVTSWGGIFTGRMQDCHWEVTGTNQTALNVGTGARIYNSTLIGSGTGKSINAGSAVNAVIAQCRLNKGIGSNVTNLIATPYNVDDADIS